MAGQADGAPEGISNGSPDGAAEEALQESLETLRSSAAWFSDAARLAPEGDEDARVNLEIVLRRIQQLADQINRDGHLEARLDRIIDDQRGLRDQLRQLLADVESEQGADFRHRFESLAASERALLAETAEVADLAAGERAPSRRTGRGCAGARAARPGVSARRHGPLPAACAAVHERHAQATAPSRGRARASPRGHCARGAETCPGTVAGPGGGAEGGGRGRVVPGGARGRAGHGVGGRRRGRAATLA